MIREAVSAATTIAVVAGCGGATESALSTTTDTVAVTETKAPLSTPLAKADEGAQWVETQAGQPAAFSVNLPDSSQPAIDPGVWAGTARHHNPNNVVRCAASQWAGADRSELIGAWGTPIGEEKVEFTIAPVPGIVQLTGDCDWNGGWDG